MERACAGIERRHLSTYVLSSKKHLSSRYPGFLSLINLSSSSSAMAFRPSQGACRSGLVATRPRLAQRIHGRIKPQLVVKPIALARTGSQVVRPAYLRCFHSSVFVRQDNSADAASRPHTKSGSSICDILTIRLVHVHVKTFPTPHSPLAFQERLFRMNAASR